MPRSLHTTVLCRNLRECGVPPSAKKLAAWERTLPGRLPEDYRLFLQTFNGGTFYDPVSFGLWRGLPRRAPFGTIGAFTFYGLGWGDWARWMDLEASASTHESRIPASTIPIGDCAGQDLLLLDLGDKGSIALWERDSELHVDAEANRIPVSSSFTRFAASLVTDSLKERRDDAMSESEPALSIESHDLKGLQKWVVANGPLEDLDGHGVELLRLACEFSDFEGASWLLNQGVPVAGRIKRGTRAPINEAEMAGAGDLVILLLEHGADPELLKRKKGQPHEYIAGFVDQWRKKKRKSRRLGAVS